MEGSFLGKRNAATSPTTAKTVKTIIAHAYPSLPVAKLETITVPAIATPNDEPKLETLRDKPEISP